MNPLPSCTAKVAVRLAGCGCGAGSTDDFTDCQAAESDALSWLAGRCDDGMAMTRSIAMLAAIATAIEKRMTCWNSARRPDRSRSTDGASTGAVSLASCMAWATALVNISESWRRAGLLKGCKGGPSVGIRGRQPSSFCISIVPG
ncbi:hypothetical protein V1278_002713 [Bradyrhizobium sp. AZCC 1577]|uniref:hypothetical protein n=1 Tax=Bradyrhizobium sp. AZCC 1577 TaxID=3117019 RepID=UPI002FEFE12E